MTTTPSDSGPFLTAACLCEKVLVEQDGVKSAIRIIDRITRTVVGPEPPPEMEPFDYDFTFLIKLKSGWARGVFAVRLELVKPSGERLPPFTQNVLFEGDEDRGVDIVGHMRVRLDQTGIHWVHVYVGDRHFTQIPFRVIYMPQIRQLQASTDDSPPA